MASLAATKGRESAEQLCTLQAVPDGGVEDGVGLGHAEGSLTTSEDLEAAGTPRVPQPAVISRFETDVAGRPALHGTRPLPSPSRTADPAIGLCCMF